MHYNILLMPKLIVTFHELVFAIFLANVKALSNTVIEMNMLKQTFQLFQSRLQTKLSFLFIVCLNLDN